MKDQMKHFLSDVLENMAGDTGNMTRTFTVS